MKKKLVALGLTGLLAFGLTACGGEQKPADSTSTAVSESKPAKETSETSAKSESEKTQPTEEEKDVIVGLLLGELLTEVGYTPGDEEVAKNLEELFDDVTEDGYYNPESLHILTKGLFKGYGEDKAEKEEEGIPVPQLIGAVRNHLKEESSKNIEPGDETIISYVVGDKDNNKDGSMNLLGYFTIMNFDADKDNPKDLRVKNGMGTVEMFTIALNEKGQYEVTDCITAEDGEGYSESIASMCEYMGIDTDTFYEEIAVSDLTYVSDLYSFLDEHPEYDRIEFRGELVSKEDLVKIANELFDEYLIMYGLTDLAS